jgi:Flp pilus assembly pilin Flp
VKAATPRKWFGLRQWRLRGQGLVEYAIIIVLIAVVILLILTYLGEVVFTSYYSKLGSTMVDVNTR